MSYQGTPSGLSLSAISLHSWGRSTYFPEFLFIFRHFCVFWHPIKGWLQVSPCLRHLCARPTWTKISYPVITGEVWLHYHESLLARISTFSFRVFYCSITRLPKSISYSSYYRSARWLHFYEYLDFLRKNYSAPLLISPSLGFDSCCYERRYVYCYRCAHRLHFYEYLDFLRKNYSASLLSRTNLGF